MSCMWLMHTCVPTTPLFSHFAKYSRNNSTQNKWREPEKAERILPQEMPRGKIQADRHTNSAISSNTQWICGTHVATDTTQRDTCKTVEDHAAQPIFRPPGPTVSETPRSFLCCRFATLLAYFSKRSVQIVTSLIQTKNLNKNLEKGEIIS